MSSPNSPVSLDREGPPLEVVLRRIAEVPPDFLPASDMPSGGPASLPAVVHDVAASLGVTLDPTELAVFAPAGGKTGAGPRAYVALICWVLADPWFSSFTPDKDALLRMLRQISVDLAGYGTAQRSREDPERREELGRLVLGYLGYRPAGETVAQAQDRLSSVSAVERARVLKASRDAEERARAIRAALVKKAADEAADKWTRE